MGLFLYLFTQIFSFQPPKHGRVVIALGSDSESDEEPSPPKPSTSRAVASATPASLASSFGLSLDEMIKGVRRDVEEKVSNLETIKIKGPSRIVYIS